MDEELKSAPLTMEPGKAYDILGLKLEEVIGAVVLRPSNTDANARAIISNMCQEINTLTRYVDDNAFDEIASRVLNTYLTVSINFPKAQIQEVIQEAVQADIIELPQPSEEKLF